VKNNESADNRTTTEAREKISKDLEYLEFKTFLYNNKRCCHNGVKFLSDLLIK